VSERRAECSCGRLRVVCRGEAAKVSICHCNACRRRTGSAFGMSAFYLRGQLAIEGESRLFRRDSDNGHPVDFHFCPSCGSTVYWEPSRKPDMIGVGVGAFADPSFPMPDQSVSDDLRHAWIAFPENMPSRGSG